MTLVREDRAWYSVGGFVQQQNRSWFALITFCATTTLVATLGLALLFTGATVAYAVAHSLQASANPPNQPAPATQKISGVITDSKCAAKHAKTSRKSPAECTKACVRAGAKYTLVDGDKVYTLEGNEGQLERVAGERATVEGTVDGNTIKVVSVSSENAQ